MPEHDQYDILHSIKESALVIERDHTIVFANQQFLDMNGMNRAEVVGKKCYEVSHHFPSPDAEKCLPETQCGHNQVFNTGLPVTVSHSLFLSDGSEKIVDVFCSPVKDERGSVVRVLQVIKDITQSQQNEKSLEYNEGRFQEIFNNISSGVAIYEAVEDGSDFIIKDLNPAGCKSGQVQKEDIVGKRITEVFPGAEKIGLLEVFKKVHKSGKPVYKPTALYEDDRLELWVENYVCKLPSGEVVAVYDDVTDRQKAIDKLRQSEERYSRLFHNNHTVMLLVDPVTADIWDVNSAACSYYGYSRDELLAMKISDINMLDKDQLNEKIAQATFPEGGHFFLQHRLKDGDIRDVEFFCGPITVDDRVIIFSVIHDITERRKIERELALSKDEWEMTFHTVTDIVSLQDSSMKVIKINQAGCDVLGLKCNEIIGTHCYELFRGLSEPCEDCPLENKSKNFQPYSKEIYHEKLGKTFLVSAAPMVDENGNLLYITHVAKDITEKIKMEEQLFLSEKMSTIAGLAAGVAHEINTPLSAILQSIEVVKHSFAVDQPGNRKVAEECGVDLEKVKRYFEKKEIDFFMEGIRTSALKASRIITSLLEFSRPQKGELKEVQLSRLIDNALNLARADYNLKKKYDILNVKIKTEFAPDLPEISCVPMEIEQVLLNLVKNAIQAVADAGQKKPIIILRTCQQDDMINIEVEDNGPGIDEDTKRKIFDPFFTTKEVGVGTGLGLSVSYSIIHDKHCGDIRVESDPGQGAKFIVELPLRSEVIA